jgi:exosortase
VALVFAFSYAPNFLDLGMTWWGDANYSHGFLVLPIAGFILWKRLSTTPGDLSKESTPPLWWGWVCLAAVLVVRGIAYERENQWVENATILPMVASLIWTLGGWPLLRRTWPAVAILIFMLPLPRAVNELVGLQLQSIATTGSYYLLQLSGFWVIQEGNIINLDAPLFGVMRQLDVARACNGLKMLMTLIATVTATMVLLPLPRWKQIILLVSAVPIALISNIIRIVATGWCRYYFADNGTAWHWSHEILGLLMMPLALILVGLELGFLSWLVPTNEPDDDDRKPIIDALTDKVPAKDRLKDKIDGELS